MAFVPMDFGCSRHAFPLDLCGAFALSPVTPAKPFDQSRVFADAVALRDGFDSRDRAAQFHFVIVPAFCLAPVNGDTPPDNPGALPGVGDVVDSAGRAVTPAPMRRPLNLAQWTMPPEPRANPSRRLARLQVSA